MSSRANCRGPLGLACCLVVLAMLAVARPSLADYTVEFPDDSHPAWTLNDAFKYARAQDSTGTITILIKPGTHDDSKIYNWSNTNRKVIVKAKELGQPRPILRGNWPAYTGTAQFAFQNDPSTDADGRHYSVNPNGELVLEHLELDGRKPDGTRGACDGVGTGFIFCGGVVIKDCVIHDYARDGIHFGGDGETHWACSEGPTGYFEVHDTELYRNGDVTKHNMYIGSAGILIARGVNSHSGWQDSALKGVTKNFEISGCTLSSTLEPDPVTTPYKSGKLIDVGACARGVIFNNTLNKYKSVNKPAATCMDIVDFRSRNSQYGANEPPYLDSKGILFDRAYWDIVHQAGIDLQDATNANLYHIFFWNNTINLNNPSAKTEVFTNFGTYPKAVWTDFSSWGFTLPTPEAWLERSVVWIGPNTYDTQRMGQIVYNERQENLNRTPEWKVGEGYLPDLPSGTLHFVESTNITGWGQAFSTMPSQDAQNPSTPGNFQAIEASGRRVVLTWTRSSDDVVVSGYRVYRDGDLLDMTAVPVFIDAEVALNTSYTYEVEAYDVVGKASSRASLQVNTGTTTALVARDTFQSDSGWSGSLVLTGGAEVRNTYTPDSAPGSGGTPTDPPMPTQLLRLRGTSTATRTVDLSGVPNNVQLLVRWYKGKLESDDKAYIEVNDGSGWQTVLTIDRLSTEGWLVHQAHISLSSFSKSSNFQVRIASAMGDDDDYVYFDNLEIIRTTASASTAPAAPSSLSASATSSTSVYLAWTDNASNEYGSLIERRLTSGTESDFAVIKAVPDGTTLYTDAGLSTTAYTYRVRAYNQAGWSNYSNTAGTTVSSAPNAPSGLGASVVSSTQINLTWTDNASNETGFKIERKTTGSFTVIQTINSANVTSYSDTTCQPATTYTYQVKAFNANGDSLASNTATGTTPAGSTGQTQASDDFENGYPGGHASEWGANWSDNGTVGINTYLPHGGTYSLRLDGHSTASSRDWAIRAKNLSGVANARLKFWWRCNTWEAEDYAVAEIYNGSAWQEVYRVVNGQDDNTWHQADIELSGYTIGSSFQVRFAASGCNTASDTIYIDDVEITGQPVPTAPTGLTAAAVSSSRIDLSWTDNSSTETGFKIERKTTGSFTVIHTITSAGVTSYSDTTCQPATTYTYQVKAFNAAGDSSPSNEASDTTDAAAPAAPSDLVATPESATQIDLTWTDNANSETGYRIERKTTGAFSAIDTINADATSYSDTTCQPSTTYIYRVIAFNVAGDSAPSNEDTATSESGVPAAPIDLSATAASAYRIDLAWTDTADDETGFKIERKTTGSFSVIYTIDSPDIETFADTTCQPQTTYTYRVIAFNTYGNASPSNEASATTSAGGTPQTLASDDFENGLPGGHATEWNGNWTTGGSLTTYLPHSGSNCLQLAGNVATGLRKSATRTKNMSGIASPRLKFWWRAKDYDAGTDYAVAEIYDGTQWHEVLRVDDGDDDNAWHQADIDLSGYTMNANFQVKFHAEGVDSASEYFYIDDVEIVGSISPPETLALDDFEDGLPGGHASEWNGSWTTGGSLTTYLPHGGNNCLQLAGYATSGLRKSATRTKNMSGVASPRLKFWWRAQYYDAGTDYAVAKVYDGTQWHEVLRVDDGDDDNAWHQADIDLSGYTMNSSFQVMFHAEGLDAANEYFYIDDVEVIGAQ